MFNDYIAVLDSGIGGISLLKELIKLMPNENYLYFGDNDNAPYGNKNLKTLLDITKKNLDYLKTFNIKVIALGCNTLSVNLLRDIEDYSGIKTFGVFPPVERCVMEGETLLLATKRTSEKYQGVKNLRVLGFEGLASDIESNAFCLEKVSFEKHLKSLGVCSLDFLGCKTVILGCTHYNFIKNKIFAHLKPQKIISGEIFSAKKIFKFLKPLKSLVKTKQNKVLFVGKNAGYNQSFFEKSGQNNSFF